MLSIEITPECPLSCPGCYAYGDSHLGGKTTLRELADFRGDALIEGVIDLVRLHKPMHVSLVGGEPMVRHRELSRILPVLGEMGVFTMVVTSGVIAIPPEWMKLPRLRVAVSVDGLPEHHDERRKPATYERILKNVAASYLEEYVAFWQVRPEVDHIWVSLYSPQIGEESEERLTVEHRERVALELPRLGRLYGKLLVPEGMGRAFVNPPHSPGDCLFSKMSMNYSADLRSHVEPCVFGGTPDCSQCGCSISSALHWIRDVKVVGPVKVEHLVQSSLAVGSVVRRLRDGFDASNRWGNSVRLVGEKTKLVQIRSEEEGKAP